MILTQSSALADLSGHYHSKEELHCLGDVMLEVRATAGGLQWRCSAMTVMKPSRQSTLATAVRCRSSS